MTELQRRVSDLEGRYGGDETTVVFLFRTFVSPSIEKHVDSLNAKAVFITGRKKGLIIEQQDGESLQDFEERVDEFRTL